MCARGSRWATPKPCSTARSIRSSRLGCAGAWARRGRRLRHRPAPIPDSRDYRLSGTGEATLVATIGPIGPGEATFVAIIRPFGLEEPTLVATNQRRILSVEATLADCDAPESRRSKA